MWLVRQEEISGVWQLGRELEKCFKKDGMINCQMPLVGEVKWEFTVTKFSNVKITEIDFQLQL